MSGDSHSYYEVVNVYVRHAEDIVCFFVSFFFFFFCLNDTAQCMRDAVACRTLTLKLTH